MKRIATGHVPRDPSAISIEFPGSKPSFRVGRRVHTVGGVVATIVLAIVLLAGTQPRTPEPDRPATTFKSAPNFLLPTDEGGTVSLAGYSGRVLVVNFVILVCCSGTAVEIWNMLDLNEGYRHHGVSFLSIALDSPYNYYTPEEFREILQFNWTLAFDLDGTVQTRYDAQETSTFVIDGAGVIRHRDDVATPSETLSAWLEEVA